MVLLNDSSWKPSVMARRVGWLASRLLGMAIFAALILPVAASAERYSDFDTNSQGDLTEATISGPGYGESGWGELGNVNVKIRRNGKLQLNRDMWNVPGCGDCERIYVGFGSSFGRVRVIDLGGLSEPEVIFTFYWGGAHCCSSSLIYYWEGGQYFSTPHLWGNQMGPRRVFRSGGYRLMVARDDRFAYRFDCYACSRFPIQIWQFRNDEMRDVTRRHPRLIRRNMKGHRRSWKHRARRGDAAAPLAAWTADMCLLGKCRKGLRTTSRMVRRGAVSNYFYGQPSRKYMPKLRRSLRRMGYFGG